MSDSGICGNAINPIAGTSAPLICDLPAGHDGWHGCDNAYTDAPMGRPWLTSTATRCHWTERLDLTWEDQLAAARTEALRAALDQFREDFDPRKLYLGVEFSIWLAQRLDATKETTL